MPEKNMSQKSASSRQNVRKWILIISFLLVPITIFYISPIVIMMGAAEGVATGSLLLYLLLFILSLVVARLWCGWLCPMGAWQEICSPLVKYTVKGGSRNYVKYGITVLWLVLIAYSIYSAGGIRSVDPFYGTVNGISISSLQVLMIVGIIFGSIFIVAYFMGKRGFCHVFCPIAALMIVGRKIRNLIGWPALQIDADASRCIDCNKCSKECPMGLDVHGMVRQEKMENAECILCGSCADACLKGAIRYGVRGR